MPGGHFQPRDGNLNGKSGMVGNRNIRRGERRIAVRVDGIADADRMCHGHQFIDGKCFGIVHGGDMDVKAAAGRAGKV